MPLAIAKAGRCLRLSMAEVSIKDAVAGGMVTILLATNAFLAWEVRDLRTSVKSDFSEMGGKQDGLRSDITQLALTVTSQVQNAAARESRLARLEQELGSMRTKIEEMTVRIVRMEQP